MTFRRREVGSLQPILGGGVWILAHHEAPFQRGLGRGFINAPYKPSIESKDRFRSRCRFGDFARENGEYMGVEEDEDEDEEPPRADEISDERTNRFHREEPHKASDHIFRISISISWLNRLWGQASECVGLDVQAVLPEDEVMRAIYLVHGVIVPINKPLQQKCTNGLELGAYQVNRDEILCRWFEFKAGVEKGDALFDELVDTRPLGEGARDLANKSRFYRNIKILMD
jgi:hypothetical protein